MVCYYKFELMTYNLYLAPGSLMATISNRSINVLINIMTLFMHIQQAYTHTHVHKTLRLVLRMSDILEGWNSQDRN